MNASKLIRVVRTSLDLLLGGSLIGFILKVNHAAHDIGMVWTDMPGGFRQVLVSLGAWAFSLGGLSVLILATLVAVRIHDFRELQKSRAALKELGSKNQELEALLSEALKKAKSRKAATSYRPSSSARKTARMAPVASSPEEVSKKIRPPKSPPRARGKKAANDG